MKYSHLIIAAVWPLATACSSSSPEPTPTSSPTPRASKCPEFAAACGEWVNATTPLGCGDPLLSGGTSDPAGCDCSLTEIHDSFLVGYTPVECDPEAAAMARCAAAHPACGTLEDSRRRFRSWQQSLEPGDACAAELHALAVCTTTHSSFNLNSFVPWGASGLDFINSGDACDYCLGQCKAEQLTCLKDIHCWQLQKCSGGAGVKCSSGYSAGTPKYEAWSGCAESKCSAACAPGSGGGGTGGSGPATCADKGFCGPSTDRCECGLSCLHLGSGSYMCGHSCSKDADCTSKTDPQSGTRYTTCAQGLDTPAMTYASFCR